MKTSDSLLRGLCAWLREYALGSVRSLWLASDGPGSADLVPRPATSALKAASGTLTQAVVVTSKQACLDQHGQGRPSENQGDAECQVVRGGEEGSEDDPARAQSS